MNKTLIALTVAIVILAGLMGYVLYSQNEAASLSASGLGPNHYTGDNFLVPFFMSNSGVGAPCSVTSWNPAAVGSTTVASVDVTLTGAKLGDVIQTALGTSTQGLTLEGNVTSTNKVNIILSDGDNSGAATDIATTTIRVCMTH